MVTRARARDAHYATWGALLADLAARVRADNGELLLASSIGRKLAGAPAYCNGGSGLTEWPGAVTDGAETAADALANLGALGAPAGCPAARERVHTLLRTLAPAKRARAPRRAMRWSAQANGELSPDRLYSGRADAPFRAPGKASRPAAPRVRVVVAVNAPWSVEADALAGRGAAVAALAVALYRAGYRVSVRAQYVAQPQLPSGRRGAERTLSWGLVDEGRPVDADRLADCLASAAVPRCIGFGAFALLWGSQNTYSWSDAKPDDCDIYAGAAALDNPARWLAEQRAKLEK